MKPSIENTPDILFVSSYPPRQCGIATYSMDLIKALHHKFNRSFSIKVCALESGEETFRYPSEVKYTLKTYDPEAYVQMARVINQNKQIEIVLIQHEFGLFHQQEEAFLQFLYLINQPLVVVFHTVLPEPNDALKAKVSAIAQACEAILVMTRRSAQILQDDYGISGEKITVIAHGTHLVLHEDKDLLKERYGFKGRLVLSTFGLISSGKSIETTLEALPAIVKKHPEVLFLVIGKTHPEVVKMEGERYRTQLEALVAQHNLQEHVRFINSYLTTPVLLEYLQLTDIYLFTSIDPNQAVSGTFSYAMGCACPIISTPIPHAKEVLTKDTGIIIDFKATDQLTDAILLLLNDEALRNRMSFNALQYIVASCWENAAVAHAMLLHNVAPQTIPLRFTLPEIDMSHLKRMTTSFGLIQFSRINQPDPASGYALDDNARALIVFCMHYKMTGIKKDLEYIQRYFQFIRYCQQPSGRFLNYVDNDHSFSKHNDLVNLDDANGRAFWALGYLLSLRKIVPQKIIREAEAVVDKMMPTLETIYSARAIAFVIKGLYFICRVNISDQISSLMNKLAERLKTMYQQVADTNWTWFEDSLTYANSTLPEAMLDAWIITGDPACKEIALSSMDFLISKTFNENGIEVISNKNWLHREGEKKPYGEQPIDVAYTIITLSKFFASLKKENYLQKARIAFDWFLGLNRLHQIVYNPCTGGCYDGMEEHNINLNQGAESMVSYLLARLTIERMLPKGEVIPLPLSLPRKRKKTGWSLKSTTI